MRIWRAMPGWHLIKCSLRRARREIRFARNGRRGRFRAESGAGVKSIAARAVASVEGDGTGGFSTGEFRLGERSAAAIAGAEWAAEEPGGLRVTKPDAVLRCLGEGG